MAWSPWAFSARRWLRRQHGLQVRDNGIDLLRLEVELEARHARRAVHDHLAHHVLAAAAGFFRQGRAERVDVDLRLEVTDAARLGEQLLAESLLLVECGGLGGCASRQGDKEQGEPGQTHHMASSW